MMFHKYILRSKLCLRVFLSSISFISCQIENLNSLPHSETTVAISLVNQIRREGCKCGDVYYPPAQDLKYNELLSKIAESHCKDMAHNNYFDHINKSGQDAGVRLTIAGYGWKLWGENIFYTSRENSQANEAVEAWRASPTHCTNIMNPSFTEMGLGTYQGYYTQLFGKP